MLAIFFASYLVEKRELLAMRTWRLGPLNLPEPKHLGPVLVAWGFSIVIMVSQNDLGSSLMFFTLFVVMLWVATSRTSYLVVGGLLFGAASYLSWREFAHVKERVTLWLDPWPQALGHGIQPVKSWFAMANGGIAGTGLGLGNQDSIPYIQTDFIFAAVAQQMGLLGATLVIVAFMLIVGSGLRIAARADQAFDKLLAVGLTTLIGVQALHHHLGRDPPAAAHRSGAALRVLRRIVVGVELDPHRAAAADLRRVQPAGARPGRPGGGGVNVQIRRLGIGLLACYLALFVMLNWIQVVHKDALDNNALNDLRVKQQFNKDRGTISSADGALLAQSQTVTGSSDFSRQRTYPQGALFGQITGYYSFNYGATGLELTYDRQLTGQTIGQQIRSFADILNPRPQVGNLTISVRKDLQTLAQQSLGNRAGSVVVTDPAHRRAAGLLELPVLRPEPHLVARPEGVQAGLDGGQRRARQAHAGQAVPGDLPAGFDLQDRDQLDRGAGRPGHGDPIRSTRWLASTSPPTASPSTTSATRPVAARSSRSSRCRATRPSPRWARRPSVPTR